MSERDNRDAEMMNALEAMAENSASPPRICQFLSISRLTRNWHNSLHIYHIKDILDDVYCFSITELRVR